jgi:hypothetical protein
MSAFGSALGAANFQEPSSPDQTSAPQIPDQQQQLSSQTTQGQSLAQALLRRKKKGVSPTVRTPSTLAAAISKAKRARPGAAKFG